VYLTVRNCKLGENYALLECYTMSSSDFLTKISGGPCGPVFKGQESHFAVET